MPRIVFGRQVEQTASGRGGKSYRTPEILFVIHCTVFRISHLSPGWVYNESFEVTCKIQKWAGKNYEISDQLGPGPNKSFKTRTNSEGVFQILGPDRTKGLMLKCQPPKKLDGRFFLVFLSLNQAGHRIPSTHSMVDS